MKYESLVCPVILAQVRPINAHYCPPVLAGSAEHPDLADHEPSPVSRLTAGSEPDSVLVQACLALSFFGTFNTTTFTTTSVVVSRLMSTVTISSPPKALTKDISDPF